MLKTKWMFRNRKYGERRNFKYFIKALSNQDNNDMMHRSEIISTIINEFWKLYMYKIFVLCFIPFILYFHATCYYFSLSLPQTIGLASDIQDRGLSAEFYNKVLPVEIVVFTVYFTYFEIRQVLDKKMYYFTSL